MYLGIDLGTSSLKALLLDEDQNIVASHSAAMTVSRPQTGWSEQDPADWISACEQVLDFLASSHGRLLSAVRGIGLSGHMHGATLLDKNDKPLRPCILWNDTRSHREAAMLDADPQFRQRTGNIVFPGFTAPKLLWVRQHEAGHFAAMRKVLLPKDYLRLWLTGMHVSDMSDSSGTAWLDVAGRCWSEPLLEACNMTIDHMPHLVEGTAISGTLRPELASRWKMSGSVRVAGGGGDNAASAVGMGTVEPGSAFASLGTSGVLFAANGSYLPNPQSAVHTFCHALPGRWHQMGVILSATDSLNWLAGISDKSAEKLTSEAGEILLPPGSVTFLPYLSGERTPHNDSVIRGAFSGIGHETDRADLTRAVLEGVAFAFRDCQEALQAAGTSLERITAIGGGSRSAYWLAALATILDLPVDLPADGDFGAAFGAARLGLIAFEDADPVMVSRPPAIARTIMPDNSLRNVFDARYQQYRAHFTAIKGATQ